MFQHVATIFLLTANSYAVSLQPNTNMQRKINSGNSYVNSLAATSIPLNSDTPETSKELVGDRYISDAMNSYLEQINPSKISDADATSESVSTNSLESFLKSHTQETDEDTSSYLPQPPLNAPPSSAFASSLKAYPHPPEIPPPASVLGAHPSAVPKGDSLEAPSSKVAKSGNLDNNGKVQRTKLFYRNPHDIIAEKKKYRVVHPVKEETVPQKKEIPVKNNEHVSGLIKKKFNIGAATTESSKTVPRDPEAHEFKKGITVAAVAICLALSAHSDNQ